MDEIKEFLSDKRGIIFVVICTLCVLIIPVIFSMAKWNKHPIGIACNRQDNKCVLKELSYKHTFCFDIVFNNELGTGERCQLPLNVDSETKIFDLDKISKTSMTSEAGYNVIKIYNKSGETKEVMRYKDMAKATIEKGRFDKALITIDKGDFYMTI